MRDKTEPGIAAAATPPTMRILHFASDLPNQKIYSHLSRQLDVLGCEQDIVCAVRSAAEAAWVPPRLDKSRFHVRKLLRKSDRVLFRHKIRKIAAYAQSRVDMGQIDVIHAHTLFSDGAAAYWLHKKHGTPFMLAVRNVDVNYFMKYRPDLNLLRNAIVEASSRIIFLTPVYQQRFLSRIPQWLAKSIAGKCEVIPNGLGEDWLTQPPEDVVQRPRGERLRLLYVGNSSANKNVIGIINALRRMDGQATLTVVGFAKDEARTSGLPPDEPNVDYRGRVDNERDLRRLYREHDILVMPSFLETFGVVFVEALSQGTPVVCSAGQGIDGYFPPNGVAQAIDPHSTESIRDGILAVARRLPGLRRKCIESTMAFGWAGIASRYMQIYQTMRGDKVEFGVGPFEWIGKRTAPEEALL